MDPAEGQIISTIMSDNAGGFLGRPDRRPYELFFQFEDIEHLTNKTRWLHSNGFAERLHRRLLGKYLRVQGRKKWYETIEEMQTDLDAYPAIYNTKQRH